MVMSGEEQPPEVFCKKGVLGNSQENTCARVSVLMKLQASRNFKEHIFLQNISSRLPPKFLVFSDSYFRIKFCFKCEIFFRLIPAILFVFKLTWYWLTGAQHHYSCLNDILSLYSCVQWGCVSTVVGGISQKLFLVLKNEVRDILQI